MVSVYEADFAMEQEFPLSHPCPQPNPHPRRSQPLPQHQPLSKAQHQVSQANQANQLNQVQARAQLQHQPQPPPQPQQCLPWCQPSSAPPRTLSSGRSNSFGANDFSPLLCHVDQPGPTSAATHEGVLEVPGEGGGEVQIFFIQEPEDCPFGGVGGYARLAPPPWASVPPSPPTRAPSAGANNFGQQCGSKGQRSLVIDCEQGNADGTPPGISPYPWAPSSGTSRMGASLAGTPGSQDGTGALWRMPSDLSSTCEQGRGLPPPSPHTATGRRHPPHQRRASFDACGGTSYVSPRCFNPGMPSSKPTTAKSPAPQTYGSALVSPISGKAPRSIPSPGVPRHAPAWHSHHHGIPSPARPSGHPGHHRTRSASYVHTMSAPLGTPSGKQELSQGAPLPTWKGASFCHAMGSTPKATSRAHAGEGVPGGKLARAQSFSIGGELPVPASPKPILVSGAGGGGGRLHRSQSLGMKVKFKKNVEVVYF